MFANVHKYNGQLNTRIAYDWQLDLGFFKNDERGGVDGYVDNRRDRYSYDVVGSLVFALLMKAWRILVL